jgi:alpha-beta hydrolase superfamily lysophospholipase
MYFLQEKIIFKPTVLAQDYIFEFKTPFEEIFLETPKNGRIHSVWFKNKAPKGVIVYYHGNRAGLERWGKITEYFAKKNYDVFVMDYRGYGKSTGELTESLLYKDAQIVYDFVKKTYCEQDIIIYGRSLGSGIATNIASKNHPRKLILETPYYSIKDVVDSWLPILPEFIYEYKMKSGEYIKKVNCPMTIFHGTQDRVIPLSSAKKLYEAANFPKELVIIETANHTNINSFDTYHKKIDDLLK